MRSLLDFLVRIRFLLLLILLETVSMALIHRHTFLRDNVVFTTAGRVGGFMSEIGSSFSGYVGLREENAILTREVTALRNEVQRLQEVADARELSEQYDSVIVGRVVNNVISRAQNYVTIDKGASDGLIEGMGVCDAQGVVGVVYRTSSKYALVMPLINTNSSISCIVKGRDCFGFVRWQGGDVQYADLTDLPSQTGISVGDTVLTSGFSESFPMNLPVGYVSSVNYNPGESPDVRIRLAVNFGHLKYVYACSGISFEELPEEF